MLATGARPYRDDRLALEGVQVLDAWDVLAGTLPDGQRVVVADWGGDPGGLDAAEVLAAAGKEVTLAVAPVAVGEHVHQYRRNLYLQRLYRAGVRILHHHELDSSGTAVRLRNVFAPELDRRPSSADAVVLALGRVPVTVEPPPGHPRRERGRLPLAALARGGGPRGNARGAARLRIGSRAVIVPELPPEIRDLKERVGRFVEEEVYPLEERIAERGSIDEAEVDALRAKAREAGFTMLNMPPDHGGQALSMLGQVAIEEESGKATNGLGFAVIDRGPRELLELVTPEQAERFVAPIVRGEYREAWALTEPGAGSDLSGLQTSAVRDGDDWVLNGEKWFVTSEGDAGVYVVAAVAEGEQQLFLVEPDAPGLEIVRTPGFLHDPYLDHHPEIALRDCRVPEANRVPASGDAGAKEWILVERLFIAARCCGAADAAARPRERLGEGARGVRLAHRRLPGRLVPAGRLADGAARGAPAHLPRRARVRHAGRPQDRPRQGLDGEALRLRDGGPHRRPRAADPRRARLHAPTARPRATSASCGSTGSGRARARSSALILAGGLFKRGAAPYLGWE